MQFIFILLRYFINRIPNLYARMYKETGRRRKNFVKLFEIVSLQYLYYMYIIPHTIQFIITKLCFNAKRSYDMKLLFRKYTYYYYIRVNQTRFTLDYSYLISSRHVKIYFSYLYFI